MVTTNERVVKLGYQCLQNCLLYFHLNVRRFVYISIQSAFHARLINGPFAETLIRVGGLTHIVKDQQPGQWKLWAAQGESNPG